MGIADRPDPTKVSLNANIPTFGIYRYPAENIEFYNDSTTDTLLPGEVIIIGNKLHVVHEAVFPQQVGTANKNGVYDFPLDPALATNINQGDMIYINEDLADADNPLGYATDVVPAAGPPQVNGYKVGFAVVAVDATGVVETDVNGPIAAKPGDAYVRVNLDSNDATRYGTGGTVLSIQTDEEGKPQKKKVANIGGPASKPSKEEAEQQGREAKKAQNETRGNKEESHTQGNQSKSQHGSKNE